MQVQHKTIDRDEVGFIYLAERKEPKYCDRCGRELVRRLLSYGYNVFTGTPIEHEYAICPSLRGDHFIWDTTEEYNG